MNHPDMTPLVLPVDLMPRSVQRLDGPGIAGQGGFWPRANDPGSAAALAAQAWLSEHGILRNTGLPLILEQGGGANLPPENYILEINASGVRIQSVDLSGALSGVSTLCQLAERWTGDLPALRIEDGPDLAWRAAHIDLRTQKFRLKKLKQIISRLAFYRYNVVVVEYEGTFPLGLEPPFGAPSQPVPGYSPDEIRDLYAYAAGFGVELVPLIQTMGHLEYVLQNPAYHALCERGPDGRLYLDELCPLHPESLPLALRLVDRVMAVHPGGYVHIGGDEVWHLGSCDRCRSLPPEDLYLRHMLPILEHIKRAGRTPLYWADFIKHHPQAVDQLPVDAVPIEWWYGPMDDPAGQMVSLESLKRLCERGLPALSGPAVHSWLSGPYGLDVGGAIQNIELMSQAAWETHGQGMLVTNWNTGGSFQNILPAGTNISNEGYPPQPAIIPLNRRPHFDITWPLIIWGAHNLWNARHPPREGFWQTIGSHLFGVDGPAFWAAYSQMGTLALEADPDQLAAQFQQALDGFNRLHPVRGLDIWEQLRLAAEFGILYARRLALVKHWAQERASLETAFQGLESRLRAAYLPDLPEGEVEAELWERFHRSWFP